MSRTLYLHIGIQKTGSTAIQNVCMDNQDRLKRLGILFPSAGFARGSPRGAAATAGHRRLLQFMRRPDKMPLDPESRALLDEIEASNCDTIVLSSEVFSAPGRRRLVSGLRWFINQRFDARVVVYLRRQFKESTPPQPSEQAMTYGDRLLLLEALLPATDSRQPI